MRRRRLPRRVLGQPRARNKEPIMRIDEVKTLSAEAIQRELEKSYEELMKLRFRLATKQLENVSELRRTRKTIARLKTVLRQREIQGAA